MTELSSINKPFDKFEQGGFSRPHAAGAAICNPVTEPHPEAERWEIDPV